MNDQPREGRSREIDRETVIDAIDLDPTFTNRDLAQDFQCSHTQIARILKAAKKRWLQGHWVPYLLTEAQKRNRVRIAHDHLNRGRRRQSLNNIVTVDEKWVPFANAHRINQWLSPGQRPVQTPRPDFRERKVMLICFWNRDGLIHFDLIGQGHTMNTVVY